jgi:hypothetical protein
MYWIYLAIFIFVIFTPKIIQDGAFFLGEEDLESFVIFCFGILTFFLYLAKEKALLQVLQEKLHLQKKANSITKDLSDSYSYIGGMNRKFDIVKDLIFHLPKDTSDALAKKEPETYQSIIQAVTLLSKAEAVSLHFVNTKTRNIEKVIGIGTNDAFHSFDAKTLLASKKVFWESDNCVIVRSPRQAKNRLVFIIFPKITNHLEDVEMFKILASQALLLFCVDRYAGPAFGENK